MYKNCLPIPLNDKERATFKAEAIRRCKEDLPGRKIESVDLIGYDRDQKGFLFEIWLDGYDYWYNSVIEVSDSDPILQRPYSVYYEHLCHEMKSVPFAGILSLFPDHVRWTVDEMMS